MKNASFIKKYLAPHKKNLIIGFLCAFLSVFFVMLLPQITQFFIDSIYSYTSSDINSISIFWFWIDDWLATFSVQRVVLILCLLFIVCVILKNITNYFATRNFFKAGNEGCGKLRADCFKKLAFIDKRQSVNEAFYNFTSDVGDLYTMTYSIIPKMFVNIITILFAVVLSFIIDWRISLCYIVFVPMILFFGYINDNISSGIFNEARNRRSKMTKTAEEMINNIKDIKNFGYEDSAVDIYDTTTSKDMIVTQNSNNFVHLVTYKMNIIKTIAFGIIILLSGFVCFTGQLSIGYFVLYIAYMFYVLNSSIALVENYFNLGVANIGISHAKQFLKTNSQIKDNKIHIEENPTIKFREVGLYLNGKEIFEKLNFRLNYGKKYEIVIPHGEGKSALARLILRFVPLTSGNIYFNDTKYEQLSIVGLREQFSYISQNAFIFQDNIQNNILMFDAFDEKKFQEVVKICELDKIFNKFDKGVKHILTENAVELSAQERQQINIARALYKNAPILLIDNAFYKFKKVQVVRILKKIINYYEGKTIIYLTSTESSSFPYDKAIFIENCCIVKKEKKGE